MTTAPRLSQRRTALVSVTAGRALVAAVLAAVVTFSADHTPSFGLVVLGVFGIVFGLVSAFGATVQPLAPVGRGLVIARSAAFVLGGVVALALPGGGLLALVVVQAAVFLLAGAFEVLSGIRRDGPPETAGDAVVVGGLELVLGLMLVILDQEAVFTVGVLGAWGAIVAVYLGIAAVSLRRREARP